MQWKLNKVDCIKEEMAFLQEEIIEINLYFNNWPIQEDKNIRRVGQAKLRSKSSNKSNNKEREIAHMLIIIWMKVIRIMKINQFNKRKIKLQLLEPAESPTI